VPAGWSKVSQNATFTGWSAFWNWQELGPVNGDNGECPGGTARMVVLVRLLPLVVVVALVDVVLSVVVVVVGAEVAVVLRCDAVG
jgi:hypothetical protein